MIRTFALAGTSALALAGFTLPASAAASPERQGPGVERMERQHARGLERCQRLAARLAEMDRGLTAEQIRDIAQGRLAARDLTNLKVGKVTEKDGVVTLEIVTRDGALVETRAVSTKTGLDPNAGANCAETMQRRAEARGGHRGGREGLGGPGFLPGGRGLGRDLNLSADDVKKLAEAALVMQGNERLKVGKIIAKDPDTYAVDIVTRENSLVVTREVNKHSGRWNRS